MLKHACHEITLGVLLGLKSPIFVGISSGHYNGKTSMMISCSDRGEKSQLGRESGTWEDAIDWWLFEWWMLASEKWLISLRPFQKARINNSSNE